MILIVDLNTKKESLGYFEFVKPIKSVIEEIEHCNVIHFRKLTQKHIHDNQKIILSGTPIMDNDFRNEVERFQWILNCSLPILGICAGFQVLGLVYDSKLVSCSEIGLIKIKTVKSNPLFKSTFEAYSIHNYSLIPTDDFDIIARSEKCIHGIKHKKRELYGLLFHPEVRNTEIIKNFIAHAHQTQ